MASSAGMGDHDFMQLRWVQSSERTDFHLEIVNIGAIDEAGTRGSLPIDCKGETGSIDMLNTIK